MKFTITKRIIGIRFLKLGLDDSCYYEKLSYATKHIIHKICYKARRKEENMTIYLIYKKKHLVTPKEEVINVYDLGYLGVETDFPEHYRPIRIERRGI